MRVDQRPACTRIQERDASNEAKPVLLALPLFVVSSYDEVGAAPGGVSAICACLAAGQWPLSVSQFDVSLAPSHEDF